MASAGDTSHIRRPKFRFEGALRSVTIAQAKLATQEHDRAKVFLQGHRAERVQIVANLFEIEDKPTYRMYLLMDGTAEMKARVFGKDAENDTVYNDTILDIEPEYVFPQTSNPHAAYHAPKVTRKYSKSVLCSCRRRAQGILSHSGRQDTKSVSLEVVFIRLVDDVHEMDRHFLDCMMEYSILQSNEYPVSPSSSLCMKPTVVAADCRGQPGDGLAIADRSNGYRRRPLHGGSNHKLCWYFSQPRAHARDDRGIPSQTTHRSTISRFPVSFSSRSNHTATPRRPPTPIMIDLTLDSDGEQEAGGLTHDVDTRPSLLLSQPTSSGSGSAQNTPQKNKKTPKKTKTPRKADPLSGLSTLQRDLIRHIKEETGYGGRIYPRLSGSQPSNDISGLSKDDLVRAFRREQYGRSEIEDALTSLLDKGYIYATIDDEHFNVTD
ncbi:hypothetical protein BDZ89DRAFT_1153448 [Hymenopellis radicata]|nr:hypothetical protein BDZ89DRAFT_1153448 [Hymenopellis radicata]